MGHGDSLSLDARIEPLTYAEPDALDRPQCPSIEAVREPLDPWWPAHPAPARAGIRGRSLAPRASQARPAVPAPIAAHGSSRGVAHAVCALCRLFVSDRLPSWEQLPFRSGVVAGQRPTDVECRVDGILVGIQHRPGDRKSTRLNSSHLVISYAVFCLKK